MPTLVFSTAPRIWARKVLVHPDELYCVCGPPTSNLPEFQVPRGEYDIADILPTLPDPWKNPTLMVIGYDPRRVSLPRNLHALPCPKVLIICDTHHGKNPLSAAWQYARDEPFDLILASYTRHHLHFFAEACTGRVAWLPQHGIDPLEVFPPKPWESRQHDLSFVGQIRQLHPFRSHIIDSLRTANLPLTVISDYHPLPGQIHGDTRLSLNASLNGDMNLRILEILASGSLLLTDRLSPESGMHLLFEEGRHYIPYNDEHDLQHKISHLLRHPKEAHAIARAGQLAYLQSHRPGHKIELLPRLLENCHWPYDISDDARIHLPRQSPDALLNRIKIYEALQELHRTQIRPRVLFFPGTERSAADAIDLPRLKATLIREHLPNPTTPGTFPRTLAHRVHWRDQPSALKPFHENTPWDTIVCTPQNLADPHFRPVLTTTVTKSLLVTGTDPSLQNLSDHDLSEKYRVTIKSRNPLTLVPLNPINPPPRTPL